MLGQWLAGGGKGEGDSWEGVGTEEPSMYWQYFIPYTGWCVRGCLVFITVL